MSSHNGQELLRVWVTAALLVGLGAAVMAEQPIYTKDNAPKTPKLQELPLKKSVSQYDITWKFDKQVRVGRFINGDWYVVGPVTVVAIAPKPLYGEEVKDVTAREKRDFVGKYARNGSVLNIPPVCHQSGFDSRVPHGRYKPELFARLPIRMKPGDSLVSSISFEKLPKSGRPVKAVAVLSCLKAPVPADAFRPGYCDRRQKIYLARNLRRDTLPRLPRVKSTPDIKKSEERFARPWMEVNFFEADQAPYQRGGYGRGVCEEVSRASLLLMLDFKHQEKEKLLVNLVQYGIDLWGIAKSGHRGWLPHGGWGSGRKWPIVLAGILLGDEKMSSPNRSSPKVAFQEDWQTMYDDCWSGAGVVYYGHIGRRSKTDTRIPLGWGQYEHLHPSRWVSWIGTSYRTNMTSSTWIGQALAVRIMQAEKQWADQSFLDYCDRWMTEPDSGYGNPLRFSKQGNGWDPFAEEMWKAYRDNLPPIAGKQGPQRLPTGWKKSRPMRSPAVEIGRNAEFRLKGKPFFPLMMFAEHPKRIENALAIGVNVIAEGSIESAQNYRAFHKAKIHNRKFLDQLAANGLYGVFGADARTIGHPALLGWIQLDEPDRVLGKTPEQLKKVYPHYRVAAWAQKNDPEQRGKPEPLCLVGPAYRWMKRMDASRPVFLTLGPSFLKVVAEDKDLAAEYVKNGDAVGCAVYPVSRMKDPGHLSRVAEAVSRLRDLAGPNRPVFAWIETRSADGNAPVKAAHVRAEVWMAIIHGATAIGYRGFEGFGEDRPDAKVMSELKRLNEQITRLAPAILAGPAKVKVVMSMDRGAACNVKATRHEGAVFIFAQGLADPPAGARQSAVIRVEGMKAGTKIEVLDEGRTITAGDGQFMDGFGPLAEHVYRVRM